MVKVTHEETINGQKFKITVNKAYNIASVEFSAINEPVTSVDINEYVLFHYGSKSKNLLGFTVLHLKEFCQSIRKHFKEVQLHEKDWLKRRAIESIYKAIHDGKMLNVYQIPQPLWRMQSVCK